MLRTMLHPFARNEVVPEGVLPRIEFLAARLGVARPPGPSIGAMIEELYPIAARSHTMPRYAFRDGVPDLDTMPRPAAGATTACDDTAVPPTAAIELPPMANTVADVVAALAAVEASEHTGQPIHLLAETQAATLTSLSTAGGSNDAKRTYPKEPTAGDSQAALAKNIERPKKIRDRKPDKHSVAEKKRVYPYADGSFSIGT